MIKYCLRCYELMDEIWYRDHTPKWFNTVQTCDECIYRGYKL